MQHIFISGATSGIGLASALTLATHGWQVFAGGLPTDDFSSLAHPNITSIQIDITDAQSVTYAKTTIETHLGDQRLSALVNCAGINLPAPLELLTIEQLQRQLEVNLYGHLRVIQTFLPHLRSTHGRIINISSVMGKVVMPLLGAYSISKHALEALTDGLRLELSPWRIRVSLIAMGAVQTPMTTAMDALIQNNYDQQTPTDQALYGDLYANMQSALHTQETNAIPVTAVVNAITHALTARKPKTRYYVDGATKGLIAMRKFAPDNIGDDILKRALGLQKSEHKD
jgi:NAD(P)-dependent dehydrogenase (short-subunit alcohol dehydrogenase family)